MTFDPKAEFDLALQAEIAQKVEESGVPLEQWRAGGRRTKQYPNKEDLQWWLDHGPQQVEQYVEWRRQIHAAGWRLWTAPGDVPAVELEILANFGAVPVRMFIDRVFVSPVGELVVVDLKSGSRVPDNHLQLGIYACGMEMVLGVRPAYGAYMMTREGRLTDMVSLDHFTVAQLTAELEMFNTAIEHEIFIPNRGSHCISCGVRDACAAVGGPEAAKYDPLALEAK